MTDDRSLRRDDDAHGETRPLVSIIVPVFNDADVIMGALDSCLRQSCHAIEIVVVDDASSDGTADIVKSFAARDPRVRLIRQGENKSAFQARRIGILAARGDHVLFLDGDDELLDSAAERALAAATSTGADIVQFGIEVVQRDGSSGGAFETRLQPRHTALSGTDVLQGLFPIDRPAQGQVWKYLWRRRLLVDAYALLPVDLVLPRVNDLPIAFLATTLATSYVSIPDRLYRYHFGRGGSGQKVHDLSSARFYAGAISSIDAIAPAIHEIAARTDGGDRVRAAYESVRRAIIGYTTQYLAANTRSDLLGQVFAHLYTLAPASDIVHATAKFGPRAVDTLAAHGARGIEVEHRPARSILLTTNVLRTGGVSGVLLSQARLLLGAGYRVTITAREKGSDLSLVPEGATFTEVATPEPSGKLAAWAEICRRSNVDVVIDHHWLYSRDWPALALAARAEGAGTIGWAHNFAGRAILVGQTDLEYQTRYLGALEQLVVLSRLDVAFWKLRGMPRVSYLPNPPSPLLLDMASTGEPKRAPSNRRVELVWWGRLEERTKRISALLDVAAELRRVGLDFRLRIIGPDWRDMTAERLNRMAGDRSLAGMVEAVGPLYGPDLISAIDSSDLFVNTSAVEGYPLTISEAQAHGLPIVMYDLPWLALAADNEGLAAAPQGDVVGLAERIAAIAADPALYVRMSEKSIEAARRELSRDFRVLYEELLNGTLPAEHSPEPTLDDARELIDLTILFSEQNAMSQNRTAVAKPATASRASRSLRGRAARSAAHTARWVLEVFPGLRPLAVRAKSALLWR